VGEFGFCGCLFLEDGFVADFLAPLLLFDRLDDALLGLAFNAQLLQEMGWEYLLQFYLDCDFVDVWL
jgi:hypothetical protein